MLVLHPSFSNPGGNGPSRCAKIDQERESQAAPSHRVLHCRVSPACSLIVYTYRCDDLCPSSTHQLALTSDPTTFRCCCRTSLLGRHHTAPTLGCSRRNACIRLTSPHRPLRQASDRPLSSPLRVVRFRRAICSISTQTPARTTEVLRSTRSRRSVGRGGRLGSVSAQEGKRAIRDGVQKPTQIMRIRAMMTISRRRSGCRMSSCSSMERLSSGV